MTPLLTIWKLIILLKNDIFCNSFLNRLYLVVRKGHTYLSKSATLICSFKYSWPFGTTTHQRVKQFCTSSQHKKLSSDFFHGICVVHSKSVLRKWLVKIFALVFFLKKNNFLRVKVTKLSLWFTDKETEPL